MLMLLVSWGMLVNGVLTSGKDFLDLRAIVVFGPLSHSFSFSFLKPTT